MTDKVKVKARSNAFTRRFEINSSSSWDDLELQVGDCIDETHLVLKSRTLQILSEVLRFRSDHCSS